MQDAGGIAGMLPPFSSPSGADGLSRKSGRRTNECMNQYKDVISLTSSLERMQRKESAHDAVFL
jgi:hypothetical protein